VFGVEPADVRFSALGATGWQACPPGTAFRTFAPSQSRSYWRAEVAGRLPRIDAWRPQASEPVRLRFDFARDVPFALRVTSGGRPLAGAEVDVTLRTQRFAGAPRDGFWYPRELALTRLASDADGRVRVLGDPEHDLLVLARAPGHEPRRAAWRPGGELALELPTRATCVRFDGLAEGEHLRVRRAGSSVLTARLAPRAELALALAAGSYDASVIGADGALLRGTSFEAAGAATRVDLTLDRRPRVVLHLPPLPQPPADWSARWPGLGSEPDAWSASASLDTPPGGAIGALGTSWAGDHTDAAPTSTCTPGPEGTLELCLAGSGRWQIHLGSRLGALGYELVREVEVRAGETLEFALPALDGVVEGSLAGYRGDLGSSHHGVAGPRLLLLGAAPERGGHGFSLVVRLPQRIEPNSPRFRLEHVPAGRYDVFHHLTAEPRWGGVPLEVRAGERVELADLAAPRLAALEVEVVDARGARVPSATLRVRDRMHEAWTAFCRLPTTGSYAEDPLEPPPAVRLASGLASLPVLEGRLELVVERDDGTTLGYDVATRSGERLRLCVPD
jgi:hypothetical protein